MLRLQLSLLLLVVVLAAVAVEGFVARPPAAAGGSICSRQQQHQQHGQQRRTRGAPPSLGAGAEEGGGGGGEVAIVVEATRAHALLPGALATHGRLFKNSDRQPLKFVAPNEDVGINVVAASLLDGGEPVVAFVSPQALTKAGKGSTLQVPRSAVVSRPAGVSAEAACALPYYALSLLPQLMKAGVHEKGKGDAGERKLCIVTGAGPDALFAIQVGGCRRVGCFFGWLVGWWVGCRSGS
jgi:hypothetical protein